MEKRVRTRIAPSPTGDPHVRDCVYSAFQLSICTY